MNELALFAGAGGGILGGHLLGWRTICAVERDAYAAQVLAQRQTDGALPLFPIWPDVCSFDGRPWRGLVDVVSGGFPCQDISTAGNGLGIEGPRSGLWRQMARIISEVRPELVALENSPMLVGRGLALVLGDLAKMGYDARWCVLGAIESGLSPSTPMQVTSRKWPTPVASMAKGSSINALTRKSGADRSNTRLDHAVMAQHGGQLNPTWVEWLMGWPIGWTDLKPLEMARFREWQQLHSMNFQGEVTA
ncbi:DNA cytosine methyltransferase [Pseudomonas chlororaphis]|jgi:Site-specific DNA methylase|uniref:DNA cytosine methyltransferase n=1 Tax=Pseudomonas chlororaphis TaxID=587753 RepID=UPI000F6CDD90|nr:DNA cytosine methyltransferase [Pseudomonas chlororaphis]AZD86586.1 DNA-cytosine methyltransferase [Pseudomonas chlororaphis subsp. aureofaciens]WDH32860.1 DNA cytosine methyltransferase [Pseudomonas chlororaphis]WDH38942.1 DNA cytosine methyltransferase [Pseudomonas chlororaphis]